jgi:hypothetical protein
VDEQRARLDPRRVRHPVHRDGDRPFHLVSFRGEPCL